MPGDVCLLLKHMHFLSFSPIHLIAFGLLLFSSADSVLSKSKVAVQKSFNCIALEKLQSEKPRSHSKKIYLSLWSHLQAWEWISFLPMYMLSSHFSKCLIKAGAWLRCWKRGSAAITSEPARLAAASNVVRKLKECSPSLEIQISWYTFNRAKQRLRELGVVSMDWFIPGHRSWQW